MYCPELVTHLTDSNEIETANKLLGQLQESIEFLRDRIDLENPDYWSKNNPDPYYAEMQEALGSYSRLKHKIETKTQSEAS